MLHLLWTILKILGIIILVILGIILTVLLLVLLVPIRYRADAAFDGKPRGGVTVTWLLRLISVNVQFDGSVHALVRVLWFRLFDQTVWAPASDGADAADVLDEAEEDWMFPEEPEPAAGGGPLTESAVAPAKAGVPTAADVSMASNEPEMSNVADGSHVSGMPAGAKTSDGPETVGVTEPSEPLVQATEIGAKPTAENERPSAGMRSGTGENPANDPAESNSDCVSEDSPAAGKKPLIDRLIEKLVAIILQVIEKLRTLYGTLTGKIQGGQEKIQSLQAKIEKVRAFIADEANKYTIRLILRQIKRLIRHILPRKLSGRLRFGFEDPYTTGQILTYISPFYGLYAKTFTFEPVFDEPVMDGEVHIKGRIRLGTMLWLVLRIGLNKNFRMQVKAFLRSRKAK